MKIFSSGAELIPCIYFCMELESNQAALCNQGHKSAEIFKRAHKQLHAEEDIYGWTADIYVQSRVPIGILQQLMAASDFFFSHLPAKHSECTAFQFSTLQVKLNCICNFHLHLCLFHQLLSSGSSKVQHQPLPFSSSLALIIILGIHIYALHVRCDLPICIHTLKF